MEFGIPNRSFKSVREAAKEAGISRVYGGIHYANSCEVGTQGGIKLGTFIINRLRMKKTETATTASTN
jgi:hypothetical protein